MTEVASAHALEGGGAAAPGAAAAMHTLAIVKPDAVAAGKADEILHLAELGGFTIIQQKQVQLTAARAEAFYAEHQGRPLFPGLVEFMASGPAVAAVLARPDAVRAWRALVGPTNPLEARSAAPKSLRALYGADGTHNAVHGSDSAASAAREIKFFFPRLAAGAGVGAAGDPRDEAARAGVMRGLQPTLVKALTALAKAKPASGRAETLTFLANWMLDNNPNKPKLVVPESVKAEARAAAAVAAARQQQPLQQEEGSGNNAAPRGTSDAVAGQPTDSAAAELTDAAGAGNGDGGSAAPGVVRRNSSLVRSDAAVKVQAAFRGHLVRRQQAAEEGGPAAAGGGDDAS